MPREGTTERLDEASAASIGQDVTAVCVLGLGEVAVTLPAAAHFLEGGDADVEMAGGVVYGHVEAPFDQVSVDRHRLAACFLGAGRGGGGGGLGPRVEYDPRLAAGFRRSHYDEESVVGWADGRSVGELVWVMQAM
eukprot:1235080-Rhodomonas_salina.3